MTEPWTLELQAEVERFISEMVVHVKHAPNVVAEAERLLALIRGAP
jgi:hypothetical protein